MNTSDELLLHLKENFNTYKLSLDFRQNPMKFIVVDNKSYKVEEDKTHLIERISDMVENYWLHLDKSTREKTVKKFLDDVSK